MQITCVFYGISLPVLDWYIITSHARNKCCKLICLLMKQFCYLITQIILMKILSTISTKPKVLGGVLVNYITEYSTGTYLIDPEIEERERWSSWNLNSECKIGRLRFWPGLPLLQNLVQGSKFSRWELVDWFQSSTGI